MAGNIQVSSRVELDTSALNHLKKVSLDILPDVADATLTELRDRQAMPFDTGNLQNDSTFVEQESKNKVSIVSTTPYARRLYFHPEYNFRRNNNASAGGHWFDSFLNDDFIIKAYKIMFKQKGGL